MLTPAPPAVNVPLLERVGLVNDRVPVAALTVPELLKPQATVLVPVPAVFWKVPALEKEPVPPLMLRPPSPCRVNVAPAWLVQAAADARTRTVPVPVLPAVPVQVSAPPANWIVAPDATDRAVGPPLGGVPPLNDRVAAVTLTVPALANAQVIVLVPIPPVFWNVAP